MREPTLCSSCLCFSNTSRGKAEEKYLEKMEHGWRLQGTGTRKEDKFGGGENTLHILVSLYISWYHSITLIVYEFSLGHLVVNKASGFNALVMSSVITKLTSVKYYSITLLYKGEIYFHSMGLLTLLFEQNTSSSSTHSPTHFPTHLPDVTLVTLREQPVPSVGQLCTQTRPELTTRTSANA